MNYKVMVRHRILKAIKRMPKADQEKLVLLIDELKATGPVQPRWPNYSKLSGTEYHCHLSRKWVACRRHEKETIVIEVYYAGSRENAPY